MLVVVCGLPGAGKSTVAEVVADRTGGERLRTDVIRKELFPDPAYTEAETRAVYGELLERGRRTVEDGDTAVLDGTFRERTYRRRAAALADTLDAGFELVCVECDREAVRERIADREGASDADFEVHLLLREEFDPVERPHVTVDNSGSLEATRRQIRDRF